MLQRDCYRKIYLETEQDSSASLIKLDRGVDGASFDNHGTFYSEIAICTLDLIFADPGFHICTLPVFTISQQTVMK